MYYNDAYYDICQDVTQLLLDTRVLRSLAARYAAELLRDLAAALYGAAGRPADARWAVALVSLRRFLDVCEHSPAAGSSVALHRLRTFVIENSETHSGGAHSILQAAV